MPTGHTATIDCGADPPQAYAGGAFAVKASPATACHPHLHDHEHGACSADTYPADSYPADTHPAYTYSAYTYSADSYPADTDPADTYPADSSQASGAPASGRDPGQGCESQPGAGWRDGAVHDHDPRRQRERRSP